MRNEEIIDTIFIRGLENFDKYDRLNPIEIKIEEDKILRNLQKYFSESYIYRFLIDGLLFSSGITNEESILKLRWHICAKFFVIIYCTFTTSKIELRCHKLIYDVIIEIRCRKLNYNVVN